MKISTHYPVQAGLVRLSDHESISVPEFRANLPANAILSQPAWGWIEVTVDVAEDEEKRLRGASRLEFK